MATLNGMYIFVIDEEMSHSIEVTEHPVEEGINISDHTKRNPIELSISGEIVGNNAASVMTKIETMQSNGTLCMYAGRSTLSNCLITQFSHSHPHTIWGGCEFSMTLKEIRTASTSYKKPATQVKQTNKTGTQQVKKKSKVTYVYHTVKKGDTIWALVASSKAPYKKYGLSCDDVMKMNPSAFSRKGDFRTLQIGKKIIVGKR